MLNTHVQVMHVAMNILIKNLLIASRIGIAFVFCLWFGSPLAVSVNVFISAAMVVSEITN